jgi:hypothetical protein
MILKRLPIKKEYYLIFLLFFITYGYFFQGGGWNQNTRICLTRAILHQQSFIIDAYKEDSTDPPFKFVNSGDWAFKDSHYYTNKSPGMSFMALLPFAATEYFSSYIFAEDFEKQVHLSAYISTLCTTTLCASILALLIFHTCSFFFKFSTGTSLLLTLFFGLGTFAFPYSTTFYCHIPSACLSFLAFVLAMHIKQDTNSKWKTYGFYSGFFAAMAVLIEPSTVFFLSFTFIYLLSFKNGRRSVIFFLLGCFPAGLLQCFYNTVCFGGPLSSSYQYSNPDVMWKVDGKLFGIPRPRRFIDLLFLPYRGLFVVSPILIMALPGTFFLLKSRKFQAETLLCLASSITLLIFIASFYAWHGGSAIGPRYVLPVIPFAFVLTLQAYKRLPKTFFSLGVIGILINLAITLVGNEIPLEIKNPLKDVVLSNILKGNVSINPVPFSNFNNYPDIYKLSDIKNWTHNFNSFNLGELFFPNQIASLLPLLCFWIIWAFIWRYYLKNQQNKQNR